MAKEAYELLVSKSNLERSPNIKVVVKRSPGLRDATPPDLYDTTFAERSQLTQLGVQQAQSLLESLQFRDEDLMRMALVEHNMRRV